MTHAKWGRPGGAGRGEPLPLWGRLMLALREGYYASEQLALLLDAELGVVQRTLRALEADGCVDEVNWAKGTRWSLAAGVKVGLAPEGGRVLVHGAVARSGAAAPDGAEAEGAAPAPDLRLGERASRSRFLGFTRREDMTLEHHVLGALEEGIVCPMERLARKVDAPVLAVRRALETLAAEGLVCKARGLGGTEGWCLRLRLQSEVREDGIRAWEGRMETMEEKVRRELAEEGRDASYLDRQRRGRGRTERDG